MLLTNKGAMISKHFFRIFAIVLGGLVGLAACSGKDKDDFMPAEEARIEIRAASQEISAEIDELIETDAMKVLEYLMELLSEDKAKNPSNHQQKGHDQGIGRFMPERSLAAIAAAGSNRTEPDKYNGLYRYNFRSGKFDLVDDQVGYLRYLFPSGNAEQAGQIINAAFTANAISFETITKTENDSAWQEDHFTSADMDLYLNEVTVMTANFEASYNEHGMPLSMDFSATIHPFMLQLKLSGGGYNFSSTLQLKKDEVAGSMISLNMSMRYNSDRNGVDRISGFLQMMDLRFEGNMRMGDMKSCDEGDMVCMNENLNVALNHLAHRKKIADIQYRHDPDGEMDADQPELHVVYQDGSHELLADIIEIYPFSFRYDLWRPDSQ